MKKVCCKIDNCGELTETLRRRVCPRRLTSTFWRLPSRCILAAQTKKAAQKKSLRRFVNFWYRVLDVGVRPSEFKSRESLWCLEKKANECWV